MFITKERLNKIQKEEFERGLGIGYGIGYHKGLTDKRDKEFTEDSEVLEEAEHIVENYNNEHRG